MNQYQAQENYNQAERDYLEARLKFVEAKENYDLAKAKSYDILKTIKLTQQERPTMKDIDNAVLKEQSNPDTELGKAFVEYANARAEKSKKFVEMKIAERKYWDDKGSMR